MGWPLLAGGIPLGGYCGTGAAHAEIQKDEVGRPDVDSFGATMMREQCGQGFFVSFDYSSDALSECQSFFKRTGKMIRAFTVRDILDEELGRKLA